MDFPLSQGSVYVFDHIEDVQLIYKNQGMSVYCGYDTALESRVVIKSFSDGANDAFALQREYQFVHDMAAEGTAVPVGIGVYHDHPASVYLDDSQSVFFDIDPSALELAQKIELMQQMVGAVKRLHEAEVIHNNFNPGVLLYSSEHNSVKIFDFAIATFSGLDATDYSNVDELEGDLAFIAPERTGRIKHSVDYRADLYALGITFYWLLTSRLPFEVQKNDVMSLIHAHIAKTPESLEHHDPSLKGALTEIVMKLLEKSPENRYQSHAALEADIRRCLMSVNKDGRVVDFEVGLSDQNSQLQMSTHLLGRDTQINSLRQAFMKASTGHSQIVTLAGASGIGKTSLVREIFSDISQRHGTYATARFEQQQARSFQLIGQLLDDLANAAIINPEHSISANEWSQRISEIVGKDLAVLLSVMPDLKAFLQGTMAAARWNAPISASAEDWVPLARAAKKFIQMLASADNPVVMFFDDCHWADYASMRLLEAVVCESDLAYVLVVVSYRNDNISMGASIRRFEELLHTQNHWVGIGLPALTLSETNEYISESLGAEAFATQALSRSIHNKTKGNPFFINQITRDLFDRGLIWFDHKDNRWCWDQAEIEQAPCTANVSEHLAAKVTRLSAQDRYVLAVAASFGPEFNLWQLLQVAAVTPECLLEALDNFERQGLMVAHSRRLYHADIKVALDNADKPSLLAFRYNFLHDKVQEAAYDSMTKREAISTHYNIGMLLYHESDEDEQGLHEALAHLNKVVGHVSDPDFNRLAAKLNYEASKIARRRGATSDAYDFIHRSVSLLESEDWETDHEMCFAIYCEAAEVAYICAKTEELDGILAHALERTRDIRERGLLADYKIRLMMRNCEFSESVKLARETLAEWGVKFPSDPHKGHVAWYYYLTKRRLGGIKKQTIIDKTADEDSVLIMRLLHGLICAGYRQKPELLLLAVFTGLRMSIDKGRSPETGFFLMCYSGFLTAVVRRVEEGQEWAKIALPVLASSEADDIRARAMMSYHGMIEHWTTPLPETMDNVLETYHESKRVGDVEFTSISGSLHFACRFICGASMQASLSESKAFYEECIEKKQESSANYHFIIRETEEELTNDSPDVLATIERYAMESNRYENMFKKEQDGSALFIFYFARTVQFTVYGDYENALLSAENAREYFDSSIGLPYHPLLNMCDSLSSASYIRSGVSSADRRYYFSRIKKNQKLMKHWMKHCDYNIRHKWLLIEAELQHLKGDELEAEHLYKDAIEAAKVTVFFNDTALIYERAARFFIDCDAPNEVISSLLVIARRYYNIWGAAKKKTLLDREFHETFADTEEQDLNTVHNVKAPNQLKFSKNTLDEQSLTKVSQLIAGEIRLSSVLKKTMLVIIEHAGAEKGVIFLADGEKITAEAQYETNFMEPVILNSIALGEYYDAPNSIVSKCAATQKSFLSTDLDASCIYKNDPYFSLGTPRSLYCFPLVSQSRVIGVVYLENKHVDHVFDEEQLKILDYLSSMMAVSVNNARLYNQLEDKNAQISSLLEATKKINQQPTRFTAVRTAVDSLQGFLPDNRFDNVAVYTKSDALESCVRQVLWKDGVRLDDVASEAIEYCHLGEELLYEKETLTVPIVSEQNHHAIIELSGFFANEAQYVESKDLVEGLSRSLAQHLDSLQAEQNERLSNVGAMTASIVHDLKNPISAIIGFSEMADDTEITAQQRHEYLQTINKEAMRMSDMAHEILEVTSGKLTVVKTRVASREFLEDLSRLLEPVFESHHIAFHHLCSAYEDLSVDIDKMRRVLINIANNACDALVAHDQEHKRFDLFVRSAKDAVEIIARDNGPGIPSAIKANLFDPFVTHGKSNGTGLGMSTVKKIVDAHGGSIRFTTEENKGTTFTITLPCEDQGEQVAEAQKLSGDDSSETEMAVDDSIDLSSLRVLVAEDNRPNQVIVKSILKKLGLNIDIVSNGQEAFEAQQRASYDLIFMDIEMPGVSGPEATEMIRQLDGPKRDVPIYAMTGHTSEDALNGFLARGMQGWVLKPISIKSIQPILRECLTRRADMSQRL